LFDDFGVFLTDHVYSEVEEVADHGFDIPAVVTDFGIFAGFDFDEGGAGEGGEAAGDFGFTDTGGADHDDVAGGDFAGEIWIDLFAAPAVADGDGDGAFGGVLTDDVVIEGGDDFSGR